MINSRMKPIFDGRPVIFPISQSDPIGSFFEAHRNHQLIGLPTSGTTSRSRIIVRTTDSWIDSFPAFNKHLRLRDGDSLWIPGPLSGTMNLFAACLARWAGIDWSPEYRAQTLANLSPVALRQLLDSSKDHDLRGAIIAGGGCPKSLAARASQAEILTTHYYGASELSLVAIGSHSEDLQLFDRVQVRTMDDVLWVRSPWVSLGYLDDSDGFERDGDWCSVGDLGELTGNRLRIWGRSGAITVGGQTVMLAPLEGRLRSQATGQVLLVGVPDSLFGQLLGCVLTDPADLDPVRSWARANLSGADRPRIWKVITDLPLTDAGKPDLAALSELLVQNRSHATPTFQPSLSESAPSPETTASAEAPASPLISNRRGTE
jgi:acyl-CoA synthetase (AMP-forming)/AMP-acid ligase II